MSTSPVVPLAVFLLYRFEQSLIFVQKHIKIVNLLAFDETFDKSVTQLLHEECNLNNFYKPLRYCNPSVFLLLTHS